MALVTCKECGGEVSKKATTCPKCGAQLKKKHKGCRVLFGSLALIIGVILVISNVMSGPSGASEITTAESSEAQNKMLEEANTAYEGEDYSKAIELYQELIDENVADGEGWYKYAYSKLQIDEIVDFEAFLQSWRRLHANDRNSQYYALSAKQIQENYDQIEVKERNHTLKTSDINIKKSFGSGFSQVTADDGALFVTFVVSVENTSDSEIGLMSIPGVRLYDHTGNRVSRDNMNSGILNASIDNPVSGSINPGLTRNLAHVFEVAESRINQDGWYFQLGDNTSEIFPIVY